jgi:hypothetical protein
MDRTVAYVYFYGKNMRTRERWIEFRTNGQNFEIFLDHIDTRFNHRCKKANIQEFYKFVFNGVFSKNVEIKINLCSADGVFERLS